MNTTQALAGCRREPRPTRGVTGLSSNPASTRSARDRVSLCEALDRVLNKGAVVVGDVTVSVADIELIYLGLQLVVTSIERARELRCMSSPARAEANQGLKHANHELR